MRSLVVSITSVLVLGSSSAVLAADLFTAEEIERHAVSAPQIIQVADQCLVDTMADHLAFHAKWKFSKYYGDRNPKYNTEAKRAAVIKAAGYSPAQATSLAKQQIGISCIGLTVRCLGEGFAATGDTMTWKKIYAHLDAKQFLGTELLATLRQLGWKLRYWNPDPTKNSAWDLEDRTLNPLKPGAVWNSVWGGHAIHYANVMKKGTYYGLPVDDRSSLVGFGDRAPKGFSSVPFFVGVAHAGYHVFPGRFGQVIEAHSMRAMSSVDNLESSEFNPLGPGGGPRWTAKERYRSGLIAVPPGY